MVAGPAPGVQGPRLEGATAAREAARRFRGPIRPARLLADGHGVVVARAVARTTARRSSGAMVQRLPARALWPPSAIAVVAGPPGARAPAKRAAPSVVGAVGHRRRPLAVQVPPPLRAPRHLPHGEAGPQARLLLPLVGVAADEEARAEEAAAQEAGQRAPPAVVPRRRRLVRARAHPPRPFAANGAVVRRAACAAAHAPAEVETDAVRAVEAGPPPGGDAGVAVQREVVEVGLKDEEAKGAGEAVAAMADEEEGAAAGGPTRARRAPPTPGARAATAVAVPARQAEVAEATRAAVVGVAPLGTEEAAAAAEAGTAAPPRKAGVRAPTAVAATAILGAAVGAVAAVGPAGEVARLTGVGAPRPAARRGADAAAAVAGCGPPDTPPGAVPVVGAAGLAPGPVAVAGAAARAVASGPRRAEAFLVEASEAQAAAAVAGPVPPRAVARAVRRPEGAETARVGDVAEAAGRGTPVVATGAHRAHEAVLLAAAESEAEAAVLAGAPPEAQVAAPDTAPPPAAVGRQTAGAAPLAVTGQRQRRV